MCHSQEAVGHTLLLFIIIIITIIIIIIIIIMVWIRVCMYYGVCVVHVP